MCFNWLWCIMIQAFFLSTKTKTVRGFIMFIIIWMAQWAKISWLFSSRYFYSTLQTFTFYLCFVLFCVSSSCSSSSFLFIWTHSWSFYALIHLYDWLKQIATIQNYFLPVYHLLSLSTFNNNQLIILETSFIKVNTKQK